MRARREHRRGRSHPARLLARSSGRSPNGHAVSRRSAAAALGALVCLWALTRASTHQGPGTSPRSVTLHRSVRIGADRAQVFGFLQGLEHFPRLLKHVREVRPVGENRWEWVVGAPGREPVSWEATITRLIPNQVLAWRSTEDSAVQLEGSLRFDDTWRGTRVRVSLACALPAAADAAGLAERIFGQDPRRQLREDLQRFKALVERGRTRGPRGTVLREELGFAG